MNEYQYSIRAHHGMCLAFFKGKGYSDGFTKHMTEMKQLLEENPPVRIVAQTDAICSECPNNQAGICTTAQRVAEYDRQVLARCGLYEGEVLRFLDFEKRVCNDILYQGRREEICGDCQWSALCQFKDRQCCGDANNAAAKQEAT